MRQAEDGYDIVIVGSGAGAMTAALRAHDLGLTSLVIEKTDQYGGTTAASGGGVWVPLNAELPGDTRDAALTYLRGIVGPDADEDLLRTYVDNAAAVMKDVERYGIKFFSVSGYPDYYSEAPGATSGRAMLIHNVDGAILGKEFAALRESNAMMVGFGRYALDFEVAAVVGSRLPGWRTVLARMLWRYWSDIRWRIRTKRDRLLVMGRALIGGLRKAMVDRGIPMWLDTALVDLETEGGRIVAVLCSRGGERVRIPVRQAVILSAGGFEKSNELRARYLPLLGGNATSIGPTGTNTGEAIHIGEKAGGALAGMDQVWMAPCVRFPSPDAPHEEIAYGLIFERGRPGAMIVNRNGERYTNEAVSYDRFGLAMLAENERSGAAMPSWMIFDADFRRKHPVGAGGLMPGWVMPDSRVPEGWWDKYLFRAGTLAELAAKIGISAERLVATAQEMNAAAEAGVDQRFHRGEFAYDQFVGEFGAKPNPALGPIAKAPFYAVRVEAGDLGTKGGLAVDRNGQVLDGAGAPVPGLYAVGNTACSLFGKVYPGAGATLGPAMTFGHLAANHIARRASNAAA